MNDHTSDVFPIFTANSIDNLPPELFRAERIDGIFFVDMPDEEQRKIIWDLYIKHYKLDPGQTTEYPDDAEWTPAEIKSCCRQARLCSLSLKDAAHRVVPVFKTNREKIVNLRHWATDRCLSANYRGLYNVNGPKQMLAENQIKTRPKRRVTNGN